MKRDSFRVLFFLKKTRLLKNGEASVCMRITVNGTRVENNIRKSIDPALWNQAKETARGKSRRACDLNTYIEEARIKLYQIFCELEQQNRPVTAHLLQKLFFGQEKPEEICTLLGTMQEHNDQCRALVGTDYALITVRRYESCRRYLAELIRQRYGKEDLPLSEVNGELVRAFAFYLKTEKGCQQNTVIRYMKCLKKITNLARANDWMAKDPFLGIRFHEKEVVREFLTMDELQTIYRKEFPLARWTFCTHRDAVEELFDISIVCDERTNRYSIANSEDLNSHNITNWLLDSFAVGQSLREARTLHNRVLVEEVPSARGHLPELLDAMRENRQMVVTYQPFTGDEAFDLRLRPLFIKLRDRRWYLYAGKPENAKIKLYALDRMVKIRVTDDRFTPPEELDPAATWPTHSAWRSTTTSSPAQSGQICMAHPPFHAVLHAEVQPHAIGCSYLDLGGV